MNNAKIPACTELTFWLRKREREQPKYMNKWYAVLEGYPSTKTERKMWNRGRAGKTDRLTF